MNLLMRSAFVVLLAACGPAEPSLPAPGPGPSASYALGSGTLRTAWSREVFSEPIVHGDCTSQFVATGINLGDSLDTGHAVSMTCRQLLTAGLGTTAVESTKLGTGSIAEHSACDGQMVMVGVKHGPDTGLRSFAPVCATLAAWADTARPVTPAYGAKLGAKSLDSEVACPQGYLLTSLESAWSGVGLVASLRGVCTELLVTRQ